MAGEQMVPLGTERGRQVRDERGTNFLDRDGTSPLGQQASHGCLPSGWRGQGVDDIDEGIASHLRIDIDERAVARNVIAHGCPHSDQLPAAPPDAECVPQYFATNPELLKCLQQRLVEKPKIMADGPLMPLQWNDRIDRYLTRTMQNSTATATGPANGNLSRLHLPASQSNVRSRSAAANGDDRMMLAQQDGDPSVAVSTRLIDQSSLQSDHVIVVERSQEIELHRESGHIVLKVQV